MAAIASINAAVSGPFTAAIATLSADDTITFTPSVKQLLVLTNTTGGLLTAVLDGDGGGTVTVAGLGTVSVAAGLSIAVPAGESRAVVLGSVRHYLQGVVHLTGAAGLKAQLFNL